MAISTVGVNGLSTSGLSASALTTGTLPKTQLPTGTILQVIQSANLGNIGFNSSTFIDTGLSASITPTSASNKVLVLISVAGLATNTSGNITAALQLADASNNDLGVIFNAYLPAYNTTTMSFQYVSGSILHSPATTSSFTYKLRIKSSNSVQITDWLSDSTQITRITLMEVAA